MDRKISRLTVIASPLGAMPLKSVSRRLSAWREALPPRTRTQNGKAYELLVSIFGDAGREGKITVSPATQRGAGTPERAREPKTMTATEINAYLDAADPKWRVWPGRRAQELAIIGHDGRLGQVVLRPSL